MRALQAIRQDILADQKNVQTPITQTSEYSIHDVPGMGRYVIPRHTGFQALLKFIHDRGEINIDFSANVYPNFDGIIGEHFQSPHLLDPLDDQYESREFGLFGRKRYEDLRDNLAAVRNFMMKTYFASKPPILSEAKAKEAMKEIAAYLGDGLYNNFLFGGIIPNHDPSQPHIDLWKAMKPNGEGAQYIYEKILERQKRSDWARPFDAVKVLFGGQQAEDWKLPGAEHTHFTDLFTTDIAPNTQVSGNPSLAEIEGAIIAATGTVEAAKAQLAKLQEQKALSAKAAELSDLGDHLRFRNSDQNSVALMDAGERRNAVEIAKDILKGFKLKFGNAQVMDGLKLNPTDEVGVLGKLDGVAKIYNSLIAWAKTTGDTLILQNPAVLAASQAVGQLSYLAKQEALRFAQAAGNGALAEQITAQLQSMPKSFLPKAGETFATLLDTLQNGIETVLNRTQEVGVTGGMVGHSINGNAGSGLHLDPTAGIAQQTGVESAIKRNAQALQMAEAEAQMLAQQNSHVLEKTRRQQPGQATAPAPAPARGPAGTRAANMIAANRQRQATATSTTRTAAPLNPALAQQQRNNLAMNARLNAQSHLHDEEHEHQDMLLRQQIAAQRAAAMAKANAMAKASGVKPINMQGVTGPMVATGKRIDPQTVRSSMVNAPTPSVTQHASHSTLDDEHPPMPTNPRGSGRGF